MILKKIDVYILKKFLGTFFFAILLILSISVVFDLAEKIDDFLETDAPLDAIVFDYYFNFIPYFANLFTPLFVFIAVIFFTSKMAYDTEIIAILSSGVSFKRLLYPYFLGAAILTVFSYVMGGYIIPPSNKVRIEFENIYVKEIKETGMSNIHMQIEPGLFIYMRRYSSYRERGDDFSLEKIEGKKLKLKITAEKVKYDSIDNKWIFEDFTRRDFSENGRMVISKGEEMDTVVNMKPADFKEERKFFETMTNPELESYIDEQTIRGVGNIEPYLIEKHRRIASPFSAFILTLIGVSLASRKTRGGMGLHIGVGIALSFSYILFMTISTTFAINGNWSPMMATWLPNFVFSAIGALLYYRAPK
ncbi:LptF/LptG family permease [Marinilabilia sp.]|uniref:LptF/LptG family permease n=1 Tax=Marinilabilia sp. TaxID=2021252 RepID=UPI0025C47785|nr:LptF/LptG family permease [Marinilabilia sp.]